MNGNKTMRCLIIAAALLSVSPSAAQQPAAAEYTLTVSPQDLQVLGEALGDMAFKRSRQNGLMMRAVPEINACNMPTPADHASVYRGIRDMLVETHCEAKRGHKCCGAVTIDREHITMNCRLCGDTRQIL